MKNSQCNSRNSPGKYTGLSDRDSNLVSDDGKPHHTKKGYRAMRKEYEVIAWTDGTHPADFTTGRTSRKRAEEIYTAFVLCGLYGAVALREHCIYSDGMEISGNSAHYETENFKTQAGLDRNETTEQLIKR